MWGIMKNTLHTKHLSNVELALLQLISENNELSGYKINKLIEERGYREWADISETSVYVGLEKLFKKDLVEYYLPANKKGKGPLPKRFTLTAKGKKIFKAEVIEALSSSRERDSRFDLAIASIPFLTTAEAIAALENRKEFLESEANRITVKLESQGGNNLPFHVKALFRHPLVLIKSELDFVDEIINSIKMITN